MMRYSYEIFMRPRNVARALTELAELAPRGRDTPRLQITLPGGAHQTVPFTSRFKSDPIDASAGGMFELDTVIMFGVDDTVREFHHMADAGPDESGRVAVGYIYLTVRFSPAWHPRFASLQFMAASGGISRMFELSANVRKVFTDLTAASGGVCCLLDTESCGFDVCWLNGEPVRERVPGPRFPRFHNLVAAWPDQIE
jgi:hypothetical protein